MTQQKLKVLMFSDPLFRPSGYGNTNIAQLPFLQHFFNMAYVCWGWNGLDPSPSDLMTAFPGVEFYPAIGKYHGGDVIHQIIAKAKPDIILLHGDIYMFADNLAPELAKYKGKIPQIALFPIDGENIPTKWVPFMEGLDGLICLTEWGKAETEKHVRSSVRVAPLGIDPKMFYPISADEKTALRETKFPFMKDKFVVTWIGRNFSRKNPGLAVMGFAHWVKKAKIKDALLYMHCSDSDPAGFSIYEIIRRDYPHIANMVCMPENFHPGSGISRKMLAELIQCSDVGLNTSLGEGWGMPLTETMACGVPMIAPAHSACMEQIGPNGERGELIEIAASFHASNNILQHIGKPESLSNRLDALYRNQNRWEKKARAGYEWASKMTWEKSSVSLAKAIFEFYREFSDGIPRSSMEIL